MNKSILAFTTALSLFTVAPAFAQDAQDLTGVDPACIMKNADGTQAVDKTKCPDGKTMGAAQTQQPADNSASTTKTDQPADSTATTTQTQQPADSSASTTQTQQPADSTTNPPASAAATEQPVDNTTTGSTTMTGDSLIVPADQLSGGAVVSANDYIGKRVYDSLGNDIGEVNDLIMTSDGKIQATILGVGGFLGIGEKDVAVPVTAVKITKDGDSVRLVVNATKDQLEAAPSYDRVNRRYTAG